MGYEIFARRAPKPFDPNAEFSWDSAIETWCSNGRYFRDELFSLRELVHDNCIVISTPEEYSAVAQLAADLLTMNLPKPVEFLYSIKNNGDESFTCAPLDGVVMRDEDGNNNNIWHSEEEFDALVPIGIDKFFAIQAFARAVLEGANTQWDKEVLVFEESY